MNNPDKKQKGGVAIFVAAVMVMIIPLMGLAIDVGFILLKRNELQNVADATALACLVKDSASACGILANGPHNNVDISTNSDIVPLNHEGFNVSATYPFSPCINSTQGCAKTVTSFNYQTFFMGILGLKNVPLSAYAVAGRSIRNCIIATQTINLNGTPDILGTNCNILMGDANNVGNTALQSSTNNYIYNGNDPDRCNACIPAAVSMSGPVPLPVLSSLPTWDSKATNQKKFECKNNTCNVLPGYYPDGIDCGGAKAKCIFAGGSYYLDGPLVLSGANSSATDNGNGVFFYMRGVGALGNVDISAEGLVNLTNSGGVTGNCANTNNQLLIYSPNGYDSKKKKTITLNGNSGTSLVGNIYLPGYDVIWKGGNNFTLNGTLVVANYSQNGTNNFNINPTISCGLNTKIYLTE